MALAVDNNGPREIAARLQLSTRTVERHFEEIYGRLGVHSRIEAILTVMEALDQ